MNTERARHAAAVLRAYFVTDLAVQLQYRAATSIWLIGSVLEPLVYLVVWTTVARLQGGTVEGHTPARFAAYYIALMLVNHGTFTWNMWEYEYLIRDGTLAQRLLRPVHPILSDLADNAAYKVLSSCALVPAALVMTWAFHPQFTITPLTVLCFLPAFALAYGLRFLLEWVLALAAFGTTRTAALNQLYFTAALFLTGRLAPLELMPSFVRTMASVSPFRWMLSFPLDVLLGNVTGMALWRGYAVQAAWLAAVLLASRAAWRAGVRQFSAVGS
jgi:ABC-2 type transport system permease protein